MSIISHIVNHLNSLIVSLALVCGVYGAIESVTVLRRLRNCRDIIIIIIIIIMDARSA